METCRLAILFFMRGRNDSADDSARHVKKQEQEKTPTPESSTFSADKNFSTDNFSL